MLSSLVSIYFNSPQRGIDREICWIFTLLFRKGLGIVSPLHCAYDFLRKIFCYILLTDQISLPDCLCFDIGQYVYCNYLLTRKWYHINFELVLIFLIKSLFKVKWKAFFIIFTGLSNFKNCLRLDLCF